MARPRKPVEVTSKSEAAALHYGATESYPFQPKILLPTIPFYYSFKFSFRAWINERKNKELIESTVESV